MSARRTVARVMSLSDEQLQPGVDAFVAMMQAIRALPELVRPGFSPDGDHSSIFDLPEAVDLLSEAFETAPREGFLVGLACYLQNECNGSCMEHDDAYTALLDLRESGAATPRVTL